MTQLPALHTLPFNIRLFLTVFLLTVTVGFVHGLLFVEHTTKLTLEGIAERYRGSEAMGIDTDAHPIDREIQYEKSEAEILNITHSHIIALSLLFFAVGAIFMFSSGLPDWLRAFVLIEPFLSIALTFCGMWLLRFSHPAWSILIAISGLAMTFCFFLMVGWSIRCIWYTQKYTS